MNNQQKLIKQIENKIQKIKTLIKDYKQELTNHENTLLTLIQELNQIKQNMEKNKPSK